MKKFAFWMMLVFFLATGVLLDMIPRILPIYIPFVVYLSIAIIFAFITVRFLKLRSLFMLPVVFIFICVIQIIWSLPTSTRKVFLRALHSVEIGMTIQQIDQIMQTNYYDTGQNANFNGSLICLSSDQGNFNADIGRITFIDGHATKIEFLPD